MTPEEIVALSLERDRWRTRAELADLERRFWRALCLVIALAAGFALFLQSPWFPPFFRWILGQ